MLVWPEFSHHPCALPIHGSLDESAQHSKMKASYLLSQSIRATQKFETLAVLTNPFLWIRNHPLSVRKNCESSLAKICLWRKKLPHYIGIRSGSNLSSPRSRYARQASPWRALSHAGEPRSIFSMMRTALSPSRRCHSPNRNPKVSSN